MAVPSTESLPDHAGESYLAVLGRLHRVLSPKSYFEIGTKAGESLKLAKCPTVAVDPKFVLDLPHVLQGKSICALYETTSDDFFADVDPRTIFRRPIDLAFLDGMHRCEFLLRDFMNTERSCRPNSIIALHDCIPVDHEMTRRDAPGHALAPHRGDWWTGDVWRTAIALKEFRPDLRITALDAQPTGLLLVTNLDPASTTLRQHYAKILDWMFARALSEYTLARLHADLGIESTAAIASDEQVTARFWL